MDAQIKFNFCLNRSGGVKTEITFAEGMPSFFEIKQKNESGQTQVITMTLPEAMVFKYALNEVSNMHRITKRAFSTNFDDEDEGFF